MIFALCPCQSSQTLDQERDRLHKLVTDTPQLKTTRCKWLWIPAANALTGVIIRSGLAAVHRGVAVSVWPAHRGDQTQPPA